MLTKCPRRCAPAADPAPAPGGAAPGAAESAATPAVGDVLDAGALDRLRELDPLGKNKLLARVSLAFQASTARLLPLLREAEQTQDMTGVRHVAHTLKSSSASLGALRLSRQCAELEAQVRLDSVENLGFQVDEIGNEIEVVLQALKKLMDTAE